MTETARFVDDDKDLNLPKVQATDGQTGYDVAGLLRSTGNVMLDPGFVNTASCRSSVTCSSRPRRQARSRRFGSRCKASTCSA